MSRVDAPDKLISKKGHLLAVACTAVFFACMAVLMRPYVMTEEEPYVTLLAAGTAWCLSAVFWLAFVAFQVTLADQLRRRRPAR